MTIEQTETHEQTVLEARNLSKVFASRSFLGRTVSETKAVDQVSLSLSAGRPTRSSGNRDQENRRPDGCSRASSLRLRAR